MYSGAISVTQLYTDVVFNSDMTTADTIRPALFNVGLPVTGTYFINVSSTPPSSRVTVWRWIFNSNYGLNVLFHNLHLDFLQSGWLTSPSTALNSLTIAAVWQMSGFCMAMFLAGLRGIPEELREAARVDGCSRLTAVWRVVLPVSRPGLMSVVIFAFTLAMQAAGWALGATHGEAVGLAAHLAWDIGGSFAFGAAAGGAFALYLRSVGREMTLVTPKHAITRPTVNGDPPRCATYNGNVGCRTACCA